MSLNQLERLRAWTMAIVVASVIIAGYVLGKPTGRIHSDDLAPSKRTLAVDPELTRLSALEIQELLGTDEEVDDGNQNRIPDE